MGKCGHFDKYYNYSSASPGINFMAPINSLNTKCSYKIILSGSFGCLFLSPVHWGTMEPFLFIWHNLELVNEIENTILNLRNLFTLI